MRKAFITLAIIPAMAACTAVQTADTPSVPASCQADFDYVQKMRGIADEARAKGKPYPSLETAVIPNAEKRLEKCLDHQRQAGLFTPKSESV